MGLTGQEATFTLGTAVAPNEDVTLTGQAITSAQGTAIGFGGSVVFPSALTITSEQAKHCLLYTSPSPRDGLLSRMPSSA